MKRIKLLYITRGFPPYRGGSENYIWEIYKRLSKRNRIELITYYNKERGRIKDIHEIRQLRYGNKLLELANFLFETFRISRSIDFDVIHAVTYPSGLCALLTKRLMKKPLVVTIHDIGVIEKDIQNVSPIVKLFKGFLQGIVCNSADAIIVPSEKVRTDINKYHDVPKSKIFVTHYGIDHKVMNRNVKRGVMREKWGLKNESIILYVGMYSPKKGLEYLIEAVKNVKKEIPNIVLVIAGPAIDLNYEQKIKRLVNKVGLEDSVIFTGYFDEKFKPNVYADADIVVEPTLYGMGYSFTCIEASSLGKPIIATKLLENIGVVKNGINSLVVQPRNSHALLKSIKTILKNKKLYEKLSVGAEKFAKKIQLG